uniref:Uncharacterized protein n=1 Tax=Leersia perrieri TaxID=77586 RepID=A0A0D9X9I4_9ORYZ
MALLRTRFDEEIEQWIKEERKKGMKRKRKSRGTVGTAGRLYASACVPEKRTCRVAACIPNSPVYLLCMGVRWAFAAADDDGGIVASGFLLCWAAGWLLWTAPRPSDAVVLPVVTGVLQYMYSLWGSCDYQLAKDN